MASNIVSQANAFVNIIDSVQDENKDNCAVMGEVSVQLGQNVDLLHLILKGKRSVLVCEKTPLKCEESYLDTTGGSVDHSRVEETLMNVEPDHQPLSVMKARQLLSWFTMAHNPNMPLVKAPAAPWPLWVRCDGLDPCATAWFGAEPVFIENKTAGMKLYMVTCKSPTGDETSTTTLDELKREHQMRHHNSAMVTKGYAQYNPIDSMKDKGLESQSSVIVSLQWNNVLKFLECPPLSSVATLNIKVAVGDVRSPLYQTYREMEFLLALAEGLRTGETEWLEQVETLSAVDLTKALIEELENISNGVPGVSAKESRKLKSKAEMAADYNLMVIKRGDLDFTEQLWERMRKSVTSFQDITDCLKIVLKAVKYGQIKPWIHKSSNSSLSRLILQSYQKQMDSVTLTGLTPTRMLLEMGLDKMRKDFINCLVGKELTTLNYLSFYLETEVDLQEQVMRLRKLHHILEILGTVLNLPHERLFLFTQSCLKFYKTSPYDENHVFRLQVNPTHISYFYEKEQPMRWGVEVSSGQASGQVQTSLFLSDKPPVDHVSFDLESPQVESMNGADEKMAYYRTLETCSLISFN